MNCSGNGKWETAEQEHSVSEGLREKMGVKTP